MFTDTVFAILCKTVPSLIFFIPLLGACILCIWSLHSYLRLRHVPGPLAAAFTNLLRVSWILSDRAHQIHIDLHQKHGKLVRFGPNMVSVGDAAEIQTIYNFSGKFAKVRAVSVSKSPDMIQVSLISLQSPTSIVYYSSTQKVSRRRRYLQRRTKICIKCSENLFQQSTR